MLVLGNVGLEHTILVGWNVLRLLSIFPESLVLQEWPKLSKILKIRLRALIECMRGIRLFELSSIWSRCLHYDDYVKDNMPPLLTGTVNQLIASLKPHQDIFCIRT